MSERVLIAGIGNVFFGDDGFGVEVATRLAEQRLPPGVVAADFGISGLHLAYEMLGGEHELTILVDAAPRGGTPGTLYLIEPDPNECADAAPGGVDAHGMAPATVLGLLRRLGGTPGRVLVLGCEPASVTEGIGLSEPVSAAVDEAVIRVLELATAGRSESDVPRHSR
ncbi:hydrogenase maturation protease [Saccharomonospora amisosensis]|uniref:Hydrogenase maturation protease n=1 Tax=Saccharomonospora amisosensis TaxID=1128677 RepID=A0A7X5UU84_9PSEU|nr:hydrogenase maturation protease [Saccharomonospora amisosensis]NIJ13799.1 hydrogenase maturation protease [Saccharomonospora amisosensis]